MTPQIKQLENDLVRIAKLIKSMEEKRPGKGQALLPIYRRFQAELAQEQARNNELQNIFNIANES